jgi:hypothetical protein
VAGRRRSRRRRGARLGQRGGRLVLGRRRSGPGPLLVLYRPQPATRLLGRLPVRPRPTRDEEARSLGPPLPFHWRRPSARAESPVIASPWNWWRSRPYRPHRPWRDQRGSSRCLRLTDGCRSAPPRRVGALTIALPIIIPSTTNRRSLSPQWPRQIKPRPTFRRSIGLVRAVAGACGKKARRIRAAPRRSGGAAENCRHRVAGGKAGVRVGASDDE